MNDKEKDALLTIQDKLDRMAKDVPEMPADFHASWMRAVEEDMENNVQTREEVKKAPEHGKKKYTWVKRTLAVAAAAVFLIGGTVITRDRLNPRNSYKASTPYYDSDAAYGTTYKAAGSGYAEMGAMPMTEASYADYAYEEAAYEAPAAAKSTSNGAAQIPDPAVSDKKIIRTVTMKLGTKAYDDLYASIRDRVTELGGWVEAANESSSSSGLRTANMTLRVPQEHLDEFTGFLAQDGRMISRSESATDVTESYQDTQTRLATQQAMMDRLLNLVTTAADLSDLLMLESQIADTQYTIDRLQSSLNSTDRKVNYSTVSLTLKEETEHADVKNVEKTFGQRVASAFKTGIEDFVDFMEDISLFLVSALPLLLCIAAVIVVIVIITRRRKAKKAGKAE